MCVTRVGRRPRMSITFADLKADGGLTGRDSRLFTVRSPSHTWNSWREQKGEELTKDHLTASHTSSCHIVPPLFPQFAVSDLDGVTTAPTRAGSGWGRGRGQGRGQGSQHQPALQRSVFPGLSKHMWERVRAKDKHFTHSTPAQRAGEPTTVNTPLPVCLCRVS